MSSKSVLIFFLKMVSFTETLNSTSFNETQNTISFNETQQMNSGAPSSLLIFKGIMLSVLTFLSISANSLTLVILHKCLEINPVTKVFLTSMTVADLTLAFLLLPSIPAVAVDRWPFGTTFCSITGFLNSGLVTRSILSLLGVTFERFLAVTRPYQYPTLMTVKRARIIVLGIWLLEITAAASICFVEGSFVYGPNRHMCLIRNSPRSYMIAIFSIAALQYVPLVMILIMFTHLFLLARFHAAKIAAQERVLGKKSDRKAFTTFFIMTICLFVQWIPLFTVSVYTEPPQEDVHLWHLCFAQLLAYFSTILNVAIYYFRNTAFKQAAKRVIHSYMPCLGTPVIPLND